MASTKQKDINITESGPMTYRQLQEANNEGYSSNVSPEFLKFSEALDDATLPMSLYDARLHAQEDIMSPLSQQKTRTGENDFWGNSFFDNRSATGEQFGRLSDIRAENQPWYSKIANGLAKAGVTAVTTALETGGLLYGIGQGIYDAANAEDGKGWQAFGHGLWYNPITEGLQKLNEYAEEYMPNYYTQDEQENPWGHIFSANFLGDKFIKNFGFMVGAFYGGIPLAKGVGALGKAAVRSARTANLAERAGMAERVAQLTSGYSDDVIREAGEYGRLLERSGEAAVDASRFSDEAKGLHKLLSANHLTEAERGRKILEGLNSIKDIAKVTRGTSQVLGSLGSALNEGAIEAINNSKDWAELEKQKALDEYQQNLQRIELTTAPSERDAAKIAERRKYEDKLALIEEGRARMGNADLLWNLPILMASNMFELGKLYTRGFDSSRRMMGTFWNGNRLEGSLKKGTLASGRTRTGAIMSALMNSNAEGMEEFLQKAASDGSGKAVSEAIARHINLGKTDASKLEVDNYLAGMGKAIADNLQDPKAWEEYFIGAVSAMFGMPVFGSQTKNAYLGKNGIVGLAGGFKGTYDDYMKAKAHETEVAGYLNGRVKDPKFKALYDHLRENNDYDELLIDALRAEDKREYKDIEFEKMFKDINAAASAGHLEEFKQLIGFDNDYTDEDLDEIVKNTTNTISAKQQEENDKKRAVVLENAIAVAEEANEDARAEDYRKELEEVQERLDHPENYKEIKEGPFITRDGLPMNTADKEGMIEILDRNREYQLQMIDNYVKIRNDIDIETDGALKDDQIELLTMMRGKILDYDKRSAEMAYDLVSTLDSAGLRTRLDNAVNDATSAVEKAQAAYDSAGEGRKEDAKKKLAEAKAELHDANEHKKLYDALVSKVEATRSERAAASKGRGEGILTRTLYRLGFTPKYRGDRYKNADELDAYMYHTENMPILLDLIQDANLPSKTKQRLGAELADMFILANDKMAYNSKVREFLGDPSKINDAYKKEKDRMSKEETDKRVEELASRIRKVNSMLDLDTIMRDALQSNPQIANAALDQAEKDGNENIKKLIADFKKAVNFRNAFYDQASKIENPTGMDIRGGVIESLNSAWENALATYNESFYDTFAGLLNDAASSLLGADGVAAKATGQAIADILADLKEAKRVTSTHEETKGSEETDEKDKDKDKGKSSLEALAALAAESEERTGGGAKSLKRGDVLEEIKKEAGKDGFESISSKLRKVIDKFNEDNPDDRIEEKDIADIINAVADERIKKDILNKVALENASEQTSEQEAGVENDRDNKRSSEMKGTLASTYKSDYITYYDSTEGTVRKKYVVDDDAESREKLLAIQDKLKEYKAYDFIDSNLLGYIAKYCEEQGIPLDIHFLRSTDVKVDSNTASADAMLFLAIEMNDDTRDAIKSYIGNVSYSHVSRIVDVNVNGEVKHYQILGVAAYDRKNASQEVIDGFTSLQTAVYEETQEAVENARSAGAPFVASSKTTNINQIFTGRLEVQNDDEDDDNLTSLYQLMTNSGESTDKDAGPRKESLEWKNPDTNFYFGVVVNGEIHLSEDVKGKQVNPNGAWVGTKGNNGAILLFVPKPDGNLYPIRCRRRSVKDWLEKSDNAAGVAGEAFIKAILAGERKNDYLETIIEYVKDLLNTEASDGKRMKAKEMLHRYFTLESEKESPIHFSGGVVSVYGHNIMVTDDTNVDDLVQEFFSALAVRDGVMFSIPSPTIQDVDGRSVIEAGVFDARLRGYYNFNANFTVVPIDGDGKVVSTSTPIETGPSDFDERAVEYEIEINGTANKYRVDGDTITVDGRPITPEEQQAVGFYLKVFDGTASPYKAQVLRDDVMYKGMHNDIFNMISAGIGFDNVYIDDSGEWVCVKKDGSDKTQVFRRSSDKGKALEKSILDEAKKWSDKHEAEIIKKTKEILGKDEEKPEDKPEDTNLAEAERLAGIEQKAYEDALKDRAGDSKENLLSVRNTFQRTLDNGGNTDELAATYIGIIRAIDELLAKMPKDDVKPDELIGATGARFSGTLDEVLVQKETDRIKYQLASNKDKPIAKTIWEWLQNAEARKMEIDDDLVLEHLKTIFKGKRDEKRVAKAQLDEYLNCK